MNGKPPPDAESLDLDLEASGLSIPRASSEKIRVSFGSAVVLGLLRGKLDVCPTTTYFLTYKSDRCQANCSFCPQARGAQSRLDMLSRVSWPAFEVHKVIEHLAKAVEGCRTDRVCLQTLNYSNVFSDIIPLVSRISSRIKIPISVSCQPMKVSHLRRLAEAGAERVSIPLDAATKEVFEKVKGRYVGGPYVWEEQLKLLQEAIRVFGRGRVTTHLIVGLGETEEQMTAAIQRCVDTGVLPAIFAFTPISGTVLQSRSPPLLSSYRRMQVSRYLIHHGIERAEQMEFDNSGFLLSFSVDEQKLLDVVWSGEPFRTSGCPSCNRPYYNEKPGGPLYNYPRSLTDKDKAAVLEELKMNIRGNIVR